MSETNENAPTEQDPKPQEGDDLAAKLAAAEGKLKKSVSAEKNLRDRLAAIEASITGKVEEAEKSAEQRVADMLQKMQAQLNQTQTRAVSAEVRAIASGVLADAGDALSFLDVSKYSRETGDVDSDAIRADLEALVKNKPYLAKAKSGPQPNPAQGSSGSNPPAPNQGQLTREDLKKMAPEAIEKARKDGRLNDLLGIK